MPAQGSWSLRGVAGGSKVTTTHANGAVDTFDRLTTLIKQSPTGGNLDLPTIQTFLRQTVDIVLYFERLRLKEVWFEPRRHVPESE